MKPRLLKLRYFVWTLVPAACVAIYVLWGSPAFIWRYEYQVRGTSSDHFANRHYVSCTFYVIGQAREITEPATPGGKCGWLRFVKRGRS